MKREDEDIAVVGMSCLFAGAGGVSAYWTNILQRKCSVEEAGSDWADPYYDPDSKEISRIYTRRVGLLGDLALFDPLAFGVVPNAIDASEPDHFIALREAARALTDAGYGHREFDRTRTGVILGRGASPNRGTACGFQVGVGIDQTFDIIKQILPELSEGQLERVWQSLNSSAVKINSESAPGQVSNIAVGRIANRLDLMGPSYMVDAACSSSLIAVDSAIRELRTGGSDMMLAGGVQGSMPPQVYMLFCQLGALSRTYVKPFDEAADGVLLGEGCGFVVLKRLSDALRDEDRVYAVLKGTGIASDGKALGLLAPRMEGESLAMKRAYERTGIDPSSVSLVEAHGTGIQLGDQTEVQAMATVFGERKRLLPDIALGSVKSMIGHCIPAAGVASLIKTVLALYHKVQPPTICDQVNPKLGLDRLPFFVNQEIRPWIHPVDGPPRRAGINAFGFGGINVHLIAEEFRNSPQESYVLHEERPHELCVWSTESKEELLAELEVIKTLCRERPDISLAGIALGLARAPQRAYRLAIVAADRADLIGKLEKSIPLLDAKSNGFTLRSGVYYKSPEKRTSGKTAFLFPGQGSPYPHMLSDLLRHFPQVRAWYDEADTAYAGIWPCRLSEYIYPPENLSGAEKAHIDAGFYQIDVAQEMVITTDLALHALLKELGVEADIMVGHSAGEYAALAASGAVSVESVEETRAVRRSVNRLYREFGAGDSVPQGSLLMVGAMERELVQTQLESYEGRIHLAMDNCLHQQVLFGPPEDIVNLSAALREKGGIVTQLPYSYAYHTPLLEPLAAKLGEYYDFVPMRAPKTPLFSCSSLSFFPSDPKGIRALATQQWWTTVQFRRALLHLEADGVSRFIEVGPGNLLTGFSSDTLRGKEALTMTVNEKSRSGLEQLLRMLGQLYVDGVDIVMEPLFRHRNLEAVDWRDPPPIQKARITERRLNLSIPKLSLDDKAVEDIRSVIGSKSTEPKDSAAHTVLSGHFALMDKFLENQRAWAQAVFGAQPDSHVKNKHNETDSKFL